MKEIMEKAKEERARIAKKWGDFFESGLPFTLEKREEMKKDDEMVAELCKKATEEWFKEQEL